MTAEDLIDRFNALDIGGFYAGDFVYRASEKFVLHLTDFQRVYRTTSDDLCSDYELQFNWILGGTINAEGPEIGLVTSWEAFRKSEFLAEALKCGPPSYGETFAHFALTCEHGKLDVVAHDFFFTIVSKSTLVRNGGGRGSSLPSDSSSE